MLAYMDLQQALRGVASYSHQDGKAQPAQRWLDRMPKELQPIPFGYRVRTSGKAQTIPVIPWIAFLQEDVTTTAQEGLYLVYLFDAGLEHVFLSMNQGVTQHMRNARERGLTGRAAEEAALAEISSDTSALREVVQPADSEIAIALGSHRFLARAYEAGSISAVSYAMNSLPPLSVLVADLQRYMDLYSQCVRVKDLLAVNQTVRTSARAAKLAPPVDAPPVFRPKNADEYLARIAPHLQIRTRTHEALVKRFGEVAQEGGYTAATNVHPRDLTLDGIGGHWLAEMKTTTSGVEAAVRDAIGQLLAYRHFMYRERGVEDPHLVAVFDGPVGEAFVSLLTSLEIEVVWLEGRAWHTTPGARPLVRGGERQVGFPS